MRQIVLDTETTGLEPREGHRIIEIGCVELIDRELTGNTYHQYINPEREVDEGAIEIHGITNEFLVNKPVFAKIADEFLDFIKDSQLVIHNAAFDVGFIDHEFSLLQSIHGKVTDYCTVLDTLQLAREKHPGQRNNLDALCKRYFIDNSNRELHGALLDSEILADVYLAMTGGQTSLRLDGSQTDGIRGETIKRLQPGKFKLPVIKASDEELQEHEKFLQIIEKNCSGDALWRKI